MACRGPRGTLATLSLLAISCGGRAVDGCVEGCGASSGDGDGATIGVVPSSGASANQGGTSGDSPSGGNGPSDSGGSNGFEWNSPQTLDEAYAQVAEQLAAEGHGYWLTNEELDALVGERVCSAWGVECETLPLHLEIVVARGEGMLLGSARDSTKTNWQLVQELLVPFIRETHVAHAGLSFTPPIAPEACGTEVPAVERAPLWNSEEHRDLLMDTLLSTQPAESGVALADAYARAVASLREGIEGGLGVGAVLLVTDGMTDFSSGCMSPSGGAPELDPGLSPLIEAAQAEGIATLVIGAPGSDGSSARIDARIFLSDLVEPSWTFPCDTTAQLPYEHFDMTGGAPVLPLLQQAVGSYGACIFSPLDRPQPFEGGDLDESYFLVHSGERVLVVNDNWDGACGVGVTDVDGEARFCPSTFDLLHCLPGPTMTAVGTCEIDGF